MDAILPYRMEGKFHSRMAAEVYAHANTACAFGLPLRMMTFIAIQFDVTTGMSPGR